jgi:hypothetical protein
MGPDACGVGVSAYWNRPAYENYIPTGSFSGYIMSGSLRAILPPNVQPAFWAGSESDANLIASNMSKYMGKGDSSSRKEHVRVGRVNPSLDEPSTVAAGNAAAVASSASRAAQVYLGEALDAVQAELHRQLLQRALEAQLLARKTQQRREGSPDKVVGGDEGATRKESTSSTSSSDSSGSDMSRAARIVANRRKPASGKKRRKKKVHVELDGVQPPRVAKHSPSRRGPLARAGAEVA